MGFDLVPVNKSVGTWSTNMSGWFNLVNAIAGLGGDISSASDVNDGRRVLEKTATDWGRRIQEGIESGRLKREKPFCGFLIDDPEGEDFTDDDLEYVMGFVRFCFESSGFRQY